MAFKEGLLQKAAELWGKVTTAPPAFEEIALKFVEAKSPDALFVFLQAKLDSLSSADKAQVSFLIPATLMQCVYGLIGISGHGFSAPSKKRHLKWFACESLGP